jgi:hypothetical protein
VVFLFQLCMKESLQALSASGGKERSPEYIIGTSISITIFWNIQKRPYL